MRRDAIANDYILKPQVLIVTKEIECENR